MKCRLCDTDNADTATVCSKCGQKLIIENNISTNNLLKNINDMPTVNITTENKSSFKFPKIDGFIITIIVLVILLIVLMVMYFKPKRDSLLTNKDGNMVVKINDDEFNIISKYTDYSDKGYFVIGDNDFIRYDSIKINNLYKDDNAIGLAAFYCPNKDGCTYKDTTIVKLNIYKKYFTGIGEITKSDNYNKISEKLGKETGVLSTDNTYKIWSYGKNIGDAYIMIKFNSAKAIEDVKTGVWWYDGEYQHMVKE
jgi:hypothetical protein